MNKKLPFFAYGFFKPGELAYYKIEDIVKDSQSATVIGALFIKDGIPILVDKGSCQEHDGLIKGNILFFKSDKAEEGYKQVCAIEPDKLYRWKEIETVDGIKVNALVARQSILKIIIDEETRGHAVKGGIDFSKQEMKRFDSPSYTPEWHGYDDVLFNEGMCFLKFFVQQAQKEDKELMENAKNYKLRELHWLTPGLTTLFKEQMAYTFLWTIIDRHNSMKYRIGSQDMSEQRKDLAKDPLFKEAVREVIFKNDNRRGMVVVDSTSERTVEVSDSERDRNVYESIVKYFYQIRCNVIHRGKAGIDINERILLKKALLQLYAIMEYMLAKELPRPN